MVKEFWGVKYCDKKGMPHPENLNSDDFVKKTIGGGKHFGEKHSGDGGGEIFVGDFCTP